MSILGIISAFLPWTTLGMVVLIIHLMRSNGKLQEAVVEKTDQVRRLQEDKSALAVSLASQRAYTERLLFEYNRISAIHAQAAEAALQAANGASTETNVSNLRGLLNG